MGIKDFRAQQVETSRLIASGGIPGTTAGIIIYSGSIASDREGTTANPTLSTMLSDVGSDVFLFISGSKSKGNVAGTFNRSGVTVFGGDIIISGTLYAERQVVEVDSTVPGNFFVTGNLYVEPDSNSTTSVAFRNAAGQNIFAVDSSNNDVKIAGSSPTMTIGDGSATNTYLRFDGAAQDFRLGLLDAADHLEIGVGLAGGATALSINSSAQVVVSSSFAANVAGKFGTFGSGDATPTVAAGNLWKTFAATLTITSFDEGTPGQIITVISTADVTFDVTFDSDSIIV